MTDDQPKQLVRVTCQGATTLMLEHLTEFQGELKELSKENYAKLRREIMDMGFSEPVSVWPEKVDATTTFHLLNGHQRYRTLKQMQLEGFEIPPIPVNLVDALDRAEAKRKVLAFTSQYGQITQEGLYEFMTGADIGIDEVMDRFRFPEVDLQVFHDGFYGEPVSAQCDPDEIPEHVEPKAKRGDVYRLGVHRLMCGDSINVTDLEQLMAGEKAQMVFTDPPWNVNYGANTNPAGWSNRNRQIINDHMSTEDWQTFVNGISASLFLSTQPGAPIYVVMSAQEWPVMDGSLRQAGFHWSSTIIWAKDRLVLSRKDYHTQYEPIWYGWNSAAARLVQLDDRKQSDLWNCDRPQKSELHPTTKPVELIERALENSSNAHALVLDLFGGSGSTLIACEKTRRRCFAMELDPKYVDTIVARWERYTGNRAELLQSGPPSEGPIINIS